jgi:hypothetical protein
MGRGGPKPLGAPPLGSPPRQHQAREAASVTASESHLATGGAAARSLRRSVASPDAVHLLQPELDLELEIEQARTSVHWSVRSVPVTVP